jgi:hypothetical protein
MAVKATYVLDDATAQLIRRLSERGRKSQSQVVREAVREYAAREEKTSEDERRQWLQAFDELAARLPERPQEEVTRELDAVARSRRTGWSRKAGQ